MRLGREVHDRIGPMFGQHMSGQRAVANVALHKDMPIIALQGTQRVGIAGIGQFVQVDHPKAIGDRLQHEIRADEPGASGYQQGLAP
jgi:hypothetical protein